MTLLSRQKLEDCFDGGAVFLYEFAEPWTDVRIRSLASLGKLDYHTDFPRPLFRLACPDGLFARGLADTRQCRVVLPGTGRNSAEQSFEAALFRMD